ncbi:serine protease [Planktomarina temperata]|nr:serine protease [bacterium]MDC0130815.1 serine protease [Planktomarina temperata]
MSGKSHKNDMPLYFRPSLIVSVLIAFFCFITAAQSEAATRKSKNTDWAVFYEKNPKECWAASGPKTAVASRNGNVVAVRRGQILLFTFFRPDEGVTGQVSFTAGYPFAKNSSVFLSVGSQKFKLETDGEWAWLTSEALDTKVMAALQRGRSATLVAKSDAGTITEDTFSLMGYTAAIKEAARRCGMNVPKPKAVKPTVTAPKVDENKCVNDTSKCSVAELCTRSSYLRSGKKVWRTDDTAKKFVAAAKKAGLSCGVAPDVAKSTPVPSNEKFKVASGTGFFVSEEGHLITNHHVIDGCGDVKVHLKGQTFVSTKIADDIRNDLAILKISQKPGHVFPLSTDSPFPLQDVIVAGFPFGERVSSSLKFTQGIVSSVSGIGNDYSQIQIDAALQPGNSGGPILDEFGNVVAVAVAKLSLEKILEDFGVVPENTNFGVKASAVKNLMEGNQISFKSPNVEVLSKQNLSQAATAGTVFLSCWMTTAQLEQMRTTKVLFNELN